MALPKPSKFTAPPAAPATSGGDDPTPPPTPTNPAAANATQQGIPGNDVDSQDTLIAKVQDQVRASVPPQYRVAVQKIVLAGMAIMFSPETHGLSLQALQNNTDPAMAIGQGISQLISILFHESKRTMPIPAIPSAAILLVCQALDFGEKAGFFKVTTDIVDNAVQEVVALLMQKVGLTPQKVAQIVQQNGQAPAGPPAAQNGGAVPVGPGAIPQAPPPGMAGAGLVGSAMGDDSTPPTAGS